MHLFLAGLALARGLPALLYARLLGWRMAIALGLLQATSLTFVVVAAQVGQTLGLLRSEASAGLIVAALVTAIVFPPLALALMPPAPAAPQAGAAGPAAAEAP